MEHGERLRADVGHGRVRAQASGDRRGDRRGRVLAEVDLAHVDEGGERVGLVGGRARIAGVDQPDRPDAHRRTARRHVARSRPGEAGTPTRACRPCAGPRGRTGRGSPACARVGRPTVPPNRPRRRSRRSRTTRRPATWPSTSRRSRRRRTRRPTRTVTAIASALIPSVGAPIASPTRAPDHDREEPPGELHGWRFRQHPHRLSRGSLRTISSARHADLRRSPRGSSTPATETGCSSGSTPTSPGSSAGAKPPSAGTRARSAGPCGTSSPLLIGEDPRPVERLWQTMTRAPYFPGGIVATSAVAGIDQALWDIKAKDLGVPLFELLGGPVRDRVRTYVNLGSELGGDAPEREGMVRRGRRAREAGFDAMKVYPVPPARPLEGRRSCVGPRSWSPPSGRRRATTPTSWWTCTGGPRRPRRSRWAARSSRSGRGSWRSRVRRATSDAMVEVARALPIPIATGERLASRREFRELPREASLRRHPTERLLLRRRLRVPADRGDGRDLPRVRGAAQPERADRSDGQRPPRAGAAELPDPRTGPRRRAVARGDRGRVARRSRPGGSRRRRARGSASSSSRRSPPPTPAATPRPHLAFAPDGGLLDW